MPKPSTLLLSQNRTTVQLKVQTSTNLSGNPGRALQLRLHGCSAAIGRKIKGAFFSERADAFVISSNRQT